MKQALYLMLGHPGSGKSYFARQLALKLGAVRLNSDHMRNSMFDNPNEQHNPAGYALVFGAIDYAAHEILKAGYSVVYDANNNRRRERDKNAVIASVFKLVTIIIWIQTPVELAVERGSNREVTHDQLRMDLKNIQKHMTALEEPQNDEKLIIIDGTLDFDKQYQAFSLQCQEIYRASESTEDGDKR